MNYKIHDNTVFIESNGIVSHYLVNGNEVLKITELIDGEDLVQHFHTLGQLPLNIEAKLLNHLRENNEL